MPAQPFSGVLVPVLTPFTPSGEPDAALLLVSCAYLFSTLMGIAHVLTFPGAVLPDRPLLGGAQLTSYVLMYGASGSPS